MHARQRARIALLLAGFCEIGWPLGLKLADLPNMRAWGLLLAIVSMNLSGFFVALPQRNSDRNCLCGMGFDWRGGGGGGGMLSGQQLHAAGTFTVTVGGGGPPATTSGATASSGINSVFSSFTAIGSGGCGCDACELHVFTLFFLHDPLRIRLNFRRTRRFGD